MSGKKNPKRGRNEYRKRGSYGYERSVPTFTQFTCSFSVMHGGELEARQIALHALDVAAAQEMLLRSYQGIVPGSIRIVEERVL
jgi:hypothetical protein